MSFRYLHPFQAVSGESKNKCKFIGFRLSKQGGGDYIKFLPVPSKP